MAKFVAVRGWGRALAVALSYLLAFQLLLATRISAQPADAFTQILCAHGDATPAPASPDHDHAPCCASMVCCTGALALAAPPTAFAAGARIAAIAPLALDRSTRAVDVAAPHGFHARGPPRLV